MKKTLFVQMSPIGFTEENHIKQGFKQIKHKTAISHSDGLKK